MLTSEEARVLGCLLEKAQTTPDHYPLTMNSLVAACNQKTNRHPVVDYNEGQVEAALAGLREKGLSLRVTMAGSRVAKFQHSFDRAFPELDEGATALMTVLLLRGRQTLGELRARTERMFAFDSVEDVQATLDELVCYPPRQLVRELPSGDGHREPTYVQLLDQSAANAVGPRGAGCAHAASTVNPAEEWKESIEREIASLREELASLRVEFDAFKQRFE